jgi:hypothetical protein
LLPTFLPMRPPGKQVLRALCLFAVFGFAGFLMGRSERVPATVKPSHLILSRLTELPVDGDQLNLARLDPDRHTGPSHGTGNRVVVVTSSDCPASEALLRRATEPDSELGWVPWSPDRWAALLHVHVVGRGQDKAAEPPSPFEGASHVTLTAREAVRFAGVRRTPAALLVDHQGVVLAAALLDLPVEVPLKTTW